MSSLSKYGFEDFDERREDVLRELNEVADIVWDLHRKLNDTVRCVVGESR